MLSNEYKNCSELMNVKCQKCGYQWEISFGNIKYSDNGCPKCAGNAPYTLEEVKKHCKSKNIEVLDKKYINVIKKMNFRCMICDYEWKTAFRNIKNGNTGCLKCVNHVKCTLGEVKEYCQKRNIRVLDNDYINALYKMNFMCLRCNHKWKTTFSHIKYSDNGCPMFAGNIKFTLDYVKEYCKSRKMIVLDKKYINNNTKINLQCLICDCKWSATFNNIKNKNSGCPYCKNKSEKKFREVIEKYFNVGFPKKRPKWLINTEGNRLELDGYNEELGVAFEYQGHQHFEVISYFKDTKEKFAKCQEHDNLKKELCKKYGVTLLLPDYTMKQEDFEGYIKEELFNAINIDD